MEVIGFYAFGVIAVVASLLVVTGRRPMYSVLLTIVVLSALAALYVLLDAPFVAVVQVIVYAGAIMVLMLFTVMLLGAPGEEPVPPGARRSFGAVGVPRLGAVLAAVLLIELVWALSRLGTGAGAAAETAATAPTGSVRDIGRVLFTDYAFAFEVTSILILVALVGAVVLAQRDR